MSNKDSSFQIGTKVKVTKKGLLSYGLIGSVVDITPLRYSNCVTVRFEKWNEIGIKELYIKKQNLEIINENEREVNEMSEVKGNYNVAMVKFLQGTNTVKEYAFALFNDDIYEGDCVLCDTTCGYGVARVVNIIPKLEYDGTKVTKEIICKVDFDDYNHRIETRKKKEAIKKQMDKMVKENQEIVLYQMLAKQNPEMENMLREYQNLGDI